MRNTLDMDATIKGFDLEKDNLEIIKAQEETKNKYRALAKRRYR